MHHEPLLQLLDAYERRWPDEASTAAQIRQLVTNHVDCCERTCLPGHLTGSAWVVSHDGKQHLLLHHRKLGKWLQPGGHADGDADVARVALREAAEESGLPSLSVLEQCEPSGLLDVDVHTIPERRDPQGKRLESEHQHHDLRFLIRCPVEADPVVSDESNDVRWFTAEEVRQQTDEVSVLRLLEKATQFLGHSDLE